MNYSLFKGCSFDISGAASSTVSFQRIRQLVQELPEIKNAWPLTMHQSSAPTTFTGNSVSSPKSAANSPVRRATTPKPGNASTYAPHVQTGVDRLHAAGIKGKGIRIAILDGPVDYLHPALGGGQGDGFKFAYTEDFTGGTDVWGDCDVHGTFMAGILGADPTDFGVVGVAPEATIEYARVGSCGNDVMTDAVVAASLAMADRGVDIISVSNGAMLGWEEDPRAVVAQRIVESGVVYVASIGNNGRLGAFSTNAPAVGQGVIAAGNSFSMETQYYVWNGTYSVDGRTEQFVFGPYSPMQFTGPLKVWTPSLDPEDPVADGCQAPSPSVPDPNSTLVLLHYGACDFGSQIWNLVDAGAQYVLFYNRDDEPNTGFRFWENFPYRGSGIIEYELGRQWISLLREGKEVIANLASNGSFEAQVLQRPNDVSGGRMNADSSWGPTYKAEIKPVVSGPGSQVLSTFPRYIGGFGILTGTSVTTPYVAGIAALMKQVNPSLDPATISSILATTANPMMFNDGTSKPYSFLASAFQQGGGTVNAYQAVHTETIFNVSSLEFNDTLNQPAALSFSIINSGDAQQTYTLSHIGAASVYTFPGHGSLIPSTVGSGNLAAGTTPTYASLNITPSTLTLSAGESGTITVSIAALPPLDATRLPIYSGYIAINSTNNASFTLPYGGIAAPLKSIPVLDTGANTTYLASYNMTSGDLIRLPNITTSTTNDTSSIPTFTFTYAPNATAPTSPSGAWPAIAFTLTFGSLRQAIEVVDAETLEPVVRVGRFDEASPSERAEETWWYWGGEVDNRRVLPPGVYKWRVAALRVGGDVEKREWDEVFSGPFRVEYTEGTVLPSAGS
ncbi:peptidase S8/S53 domain-containing protein [Macrophomina phaseolina]|uniref:Peptidase S8/S53 domain-containing protein n=1 Tax=Macrophomina phaseolina TaxID=35725 RepID=A0ABQ8G2C9_9PEZI|nr:peptidase S8/S53 domain-containing protein [Macrophomina phaseolina]